MEVDLNAVVQVYRERLDTTIYENVLLQAALQQTQRELTEVRAQATGQAPAVVPGAVEG